MCQGPIFVKYGECGEELKKWLKEVYKKPKTWTINPMESSEEKPSKWNQHYVKYINGLQADIEMRKHRK